MIKMNFGISRSRRYFLILSLPFILAPVSLLVGRYPINFNDEISLHVLRSIRLPRIILCSLTGAILSITGASLQSIFRNPLVSPYILGITQGAAFGAALSILFMSPSPYTISTVVPSTYLTIIFAFTFSLVALLLSVVIARVRGAFTPVSLTLSGIIVGALFSTLLSIIQYVVDPERLQGIVFWIMGGFHRSSWNTLAIAIPGSVIGVSILLLIRWRLNVLSMGDEEALMLGVNVKRERFIVIIASSLACSSVIAVSGIISFIGLVVPHLCRALIGPDNKYLIPASMCMGAFILLLADNFCRTLFTYEIPISIVTTLIAVPYFIYLLRRVGGEWK